MAAKKRFVIKETQSFLTWNIWILVDTQTGINYLATGTSNPHSITPLLDENGKCIIEKVV